jgi:hypothetical protein
MIHDASKGAPGGLRRVAFAAGAERGTEVAAARFAEDSTPRCSDAVTRNNGAVES